MATEARVATPGAAAATGALLVLARAAVGAVVSQFSQHPIKEDTTPHRPMAPDGTVAGNMFKLLCNLKSNGFGLLVSLLVMMNYDDDDGRGIISLF